MAKKSKPAGKAKFKKPAKQGAKAKSKPKAVKKTKAAADHAALGRALVTQEEKLYMLFHDDYHARSIFEFLRAETVQDLEKFSPQQIVKLLSQPIQKTVERIRRKLAEKNRHLAGDEAFVVEFKKQTSSQRPNKIAGS
jgi:hypothetical protein